MAEKGTLNSCALLRTQTALSPSMSQMEPAIFQVCFKCGCDVEGEAQQDKSGRPVCNQCHEAKSKRTMTGWIKTLRGNNTSFQNNHFLVSLRPTFLFWHSTTGKNKLELPAPSGAENKDTSPRTSTHPQKVSEQQRSNSLPSRPTTERVSPSGGGSTIQRTNASSAPQAPAVQMPTRSNVSNLASRFQQQTSPQASSPSQAPAVQKPLPRVTAPPSATVKSNSGNTVPTKASSSATSANTGHLPARPTPIGNERPPVATKQLPALPSTARETTPGRPPPQGIIQIIIPLAIHFLICLKMSLFLSIYIFKPLQPQYNNSRWNLCKVLFGLWQMLWCRAVLQCVGRGLA